MKNYIILVAIVICSCVTSCQTPKKEIEFKKPKFLQSVLNTGVEQISQHHNQFTFRFYKELKKSQKNKNLFFSPLSLYTSLGMLYFGASKDGKTELLKILDLKNDKYLGLNFYNLQGTILHLPEKEYTIHLANSIWIDKNLEVQRSFQDNLKEFFEVEAKNIDFQESNNINLINDWVKKQTFGTIQKIIDNTEKDTKILLLNSLYFKGKWKTPFEKENTKQDTFFINEKEKINISFMNQSHIKLPYYENDLLQMLEIPYEKDRVSLFVVLPKSNNTIEDLNVNPKNIVEWEKKRQKKMISTLSIPQLKINTEFSAKSILKQIGLNSVFAEGGNLDKISQNLLLSDVVQKTFLEITESGTEAAAITSSEVKATAMPSDKNSVKFIANKPFVYFIKEKSTNAILFMGEMKNPLEK